MSLNLRMPAFAVVLSFVATSVCAQTYTTVKVSGYSTAAIGINDAGDVLGTYTTGTGGDRRQYAVHGFVQRASGKIERFSPAVSTTPAAVNSERAVVGKYWDEKHAQVGFVRKPKGKIVSFNARNDDFASPVAINASGEALAVMTEGENEIGAIRSPGGAIHKFLAPKIDGIRPWVLPAALNSDGVAVGHVLDRDDSGASHGFVRTPDGTLTLFDVPGAGSGAGGQGTFPVGINASGTVGGNYVSNDGLMHGFIRTADGTTTSFDVPDVSGATVVGINDSGTVAGIYFTSDRFEHGFIRSAAGEITMFDMPGADQTMPVGINNSAQIVGEYYVGRAGGIFVRTP